MLFCQNLGRFFDRNIIRRNLTPRHICQPIQVVAQITRLGIIRRHLLQTLEFFFDPLFNFSRHLGISNFVSIFGGVIGRKSAHSVFFFTQFFLDDFFPFPKHRFFHLLLKPFIGLNRNCSFQIQGVYLVGDIFNYLFQAVFERKGGQKLLLLVNFDI